MKLPHSAFAARVVAALLSFAVASQAAQALSLDAHLDRDPIVAGQPAQLEILLSRDGNDSADLVTVSATVPSGVAEFPLDQLDAPDSAAGLLSFSCGEVGSPLLCEPGDILRWSLPLPDPFDVRRWVVPFAPADGAAAGLLIDWSVTAEQNGGVAAMASASAVLADQALIRLSMDAVDPIMLTPGVPPSNTGLLEYVVHYGNPGTSDLQQAELAVAIPSNAEFVDATGNPVVLAGTPVWTLGTLAAGATGQVSLRVAQLNFDAGERVTLPAVLSASAQGQPVLASTSGTSVVSDRRRSDVILAVNPSVAAPNESVRVELHLYEPPPGSGSSNRRPYLRVPANVEPFELQSVAGADQFVSCRQVGSPFLCEPGDVLWVELFKNNPEDYGVVAVATTVSHDAPAGALITWQAGVVDSDNNAVWRAATLAVAEAPEVYLAVDREAQDRPDGLFSEFTVHVGNATGSTIGASELTVQLDEQAQLVSAEGSPVIDEAQLRWSNAFLPPGQTRQYRIVVRTHGFTDPKDLVSVDASLVATAAGRQRRRGARSVAPRINGELTRVISVEQSPIRSTQLTQVRIANSSLTFLPSDAEFLIRLPAGIAPFAPEQISGAVNRFVSCTDGFDSGLCEPGDVIVYAPPNPGSQSEADVISFPLRPGPGVVSGQLLTVERLVRENFPFVPISYDQRTVRVDDNVGVELLIEPSLRAVEEPGGGPIYSVLFSNAESGPTTSAELSLSLPPFLSVTDSDLGQVDTQTNTVTWTVPPLEPGQVSRRRVETASIVDDFGLVLPVEARMSLGTSFGPANLSAQSVGSTSLASPFSLALHVRKHLSAFFENFLFTVQLANPTGQALDPGTLVLRVPEGFEFVNEELLLGPGFASDQSCNADPTSGCQAQERIVWTPGSVAPGEVLTFSVPAQVFSFPDAVGTLAPVQAVATDFAQRVRYATDAARIDASRWSLTLDVEDGPTAPGDLLRVVIHYASDEAAAGSQGTLLVDFPANVQFVAASPFANFDPSTRRVEWQALALEPGSVGKQELLLRVDADAAAGELIELNADLIDLDRETSVATSHAGRVGPSSPLETAVVFRPAIAPPGSPVRLEITLTNTSDAALGATDVALRYPNGLEFISFDDITGPLAPLACDVLGGGAFCEPGDIALFDVPSLAPGETTVLAFDAVTESSNTEGNLVPVAVRATEASGRESWARATLGISAQSDVDEDGVPDATDNCLLVANGNQRDTDFDGIGNACDADLNNDCIVNVVDLGLLRAEFFTSDADADLNGDFVVNVVDLGIMRGAFFQPPGPSGPPSLCSAR